MIERLLHPGGGSSYFMNSALSQEVNVTTSGNPAEMEYGGVLSNVIPKEGSNDFSAYYYGNYSNSSMQAIQSPKRNRAERGLTELQSSQVEPLGPRLCRQG